MAESFVGREHELGAVRKALRQGESVVLIGGRRSGKTWLLQQIGDVGRPVFSTSGDKLAFEEEVQALKKLTKTIGLSWTTGWDAFDAREALEDGLRTIGACALVIDEADRVLCYRWAGGFLAWLRGLMDSAGLGRAFAVVAAGGPVLDGYRNAMDFGSPVLNLSQRVYLDPLDDAATDVIALAAGVAGNLLRGEAGGHPALVWWAARALSGSVDTDEVQRRGDTLRQHVIVWREQLGWEGLTFLRQLRAKAALPLASVRHQDGFLRARYLCLIRYEGDHVIPGPRGVVDLIVGEDRPAFEIAISYAGEDQALAAAVHYGLEGRGVLTFFAGAASDWLVGEDLVTLLPNLYGQQAGTVVVLCTPAWLKKHWTRVEYDAALASHGERLFVLSMDGALPADWPTGRIYADGTAANLVGLVDQLAKRAFRSRPP